MLVLPSMAWAGASPDAELVFELAVQPLSLSWVSPAAAARAEPAAPAEPAGRAGPAAAEPGRAGGLSRHGQQARGGGQRRGGQR